MVHYFYLLNRRRFEESLRPALTASWRARSFAPAQPLCGDIAAAGQAPAEALVRLVAAGLSFDRRVWQALVGECLVLAADDVPRLEVAPATLIALLAPHRLGLEPIPRASASPVEQMHFGSRDLRFGAFYRPDHVGWNDVDDVRRLLAWARTVDPRRWSPASLARLPEFADEMEREEELAFARDWWPALVDLYAAAQGAEQIIVCERTV
jgi:hypothetical protein